VQERGKGPRGSQLSRAEKRRIYRRRRLIGVAVVALVLLPLLMGSALGAAHLTSQNQVCHSCHEMQPYYASWQKSPHQTLACATCHIPGGTVGLIKAKLSAVREVYAHITGTVEMPLEVGKTVPQSTCLECHPQPIAVKTPGSSFSHEKHANEPCVSCHLEAVHPGAVLPAGVGSPGVKPGSMASCLRCHDGSTAPKTCSTCHQAPHATVGACDTCHSKSGWKTAIKIAKSTTPSSCRSCHPAPKDVTYKTSSFAHAAHASTTCTACHSAVTHPVTRAAKPWTMAACLKCHNGVKAPKTCSTCHKAPHAARGECSSCHSTANWTPGAAGAGFVHPFKLVGKHTSLACSQCHKGAGQGGAGVLSAPKPPTTCVGCHKTHHGGLTDCAKCHTPNGWTPANFTHPQIPGMNPTGMSCTNCHPNGYASYTCAACHGSKNGPGGG
jgi:nitrate/TMAO reductase-like tetraheme cytochrome c subunit